MISIRNEFNQSRQLLSFATLNVVGQAFLFGIPMLIARLLEPTVFGSYSLGMLVVYLCSALMLASTMNPFMVTASEELRDTGRINRTLSAWLVILAGAVALFALLMATGSGPLTRFAAVSTSQLALLFLTFLGVAIRRVLDTVFMTLHREREHAMVEILSGIIAIGYLVAVHFLFGVTLTRVFLVLFAAPLTTLAIMFGRLDRSKIFPLVWDRSAVGGLLSHLKWTILGGAGVYLFNWGDNLVLRHFVSLESIGTYNLGYQIFKGSVFLMGSVRMYFTPRLVAHGHDSSKILYLLSHKRPRVLAAGFVAIVLLMAALPYVIPAFFGSGYAASVPVALVLLASTFFTLHRMFYEAILNAQKRYRFTQLATACFVVMNIALDIVLVMRYGAIGAAVATAVTYIAMSVAYEVYFRRTLRRELMAPIRN